MNFQIFIYGTLPTKNGVKDLLNESDNFADVDGGAVQAIILHIFKAFLVTSG